MVNTPTPPAAAKPAAVQVQKTIQNELDSMDAAFTHRDLKGLYAYFAPDYYRVDFNGRKYTLADDRAGAIATMKNLDFAGTKTTVNSCSVSGSTADVNLTVYAMIILKQSGNPSPLNIREEDTRQQHWTHSGKKWLMKTSRSTKQHIVVFQAGKLVQTIVDGKPQPNR